MYCFGKDFREEREISFLLEEFLRQREGREQQTTQNKEQLQEQPEQV